MLNQDLPGRHDELAAHPGARVVALLADDVMRVLVVDPHVPAGGVVEPACRGQAAARGRGGQIASLPLAAAGGLLADGALLSW